MSLINSNGMSAADLAAVVGNNDGTFGNGGDGWLFLLFILLLWGNNGWGNQNNCQGAYPAVQQGFDQAAITGGLQTLQTGQFNMMSSFQNCCCENRLGIANLGSQIAADGCSTRQVFSDAMRDMIYANAQNSQAQINAINAMGDRLDNKLCQLEMDGKNDRIADLQRQLEEANDAARYNGLIAEFNRSQEAQTTTLEQYLAPTPRPAYVVPNPNCCYQGNTCACGAF